MLKVKKTTYGLTPKNNELTKLTAEIKKAIQKTEEEKNKKSKVINDYAKLIQSIKKEYQKLVLENDLLKKNFKKLEDKRLTTDLINHRKKYFLEEKEKDITKNKAHIVKAAVETLILNISYQKKEKQRKKTKNQYKRYYDDEDDDLNDDADMEKATILTMMMIMKMIMMLLMKRKQITKQIKNKKRKKSVTI